MRLSSSFPRCSGFWCAALSGFPGSALSSEAPQLLSSDLHFVSEEAAFFDQVLSISDQLLDDFRELRFPSFSIVHKAHIHAGSNRGV
jgi:hypothetical protein